MEQQNTLNNRKNRQSNIELLRIIAMILIVAHHISVHGLFDFQTSEITINSLWIQFLSIGGKIGVNIFVLISGYFLIKEKSTKIGKILKLWMQIFLYSVIIYIVFVITGEKQFGIKEAIKSFLPITFSQWWFAAAYFVLYLISPYVNKLLNCLDKKEYQKMLVLMAICWCIIPTFFTKGFQSNNLIWFIYVYSVGGYIRKYDINNIFINVKCITISIIIAILTFISVIVFDFIGIRIPTAGEHATYLFGLQKIPTMIISILIFVGFINLKIKNNKFINIIASTTFGIYLIHDNRNLRNYLWDTVFNFTDFSNSIVLIPYSILVLIIIFVTCCIIELFRIYMVEKHYIKLLNKIAGIIEKYKNKFFELKFFN